MPRSKSFVYRRQPSLSLRRADKITRSVPAHLSTKNKQAGNVFILIMLGVFLFGALMYSFTKSGQQGAGNLTNQQANIAAQEILNYARLVEGSVDRVRRNGCSETEISFDNAVVAGYSNPNSPTDKSCHIFDDEGGKLSYAEIPEDRLDLFFKATHSADVNRTWGEWIYSGANNYPGIGKTCDPSSQCKELAANIHFINKEICFAINNLVNIDLVSGDAPPEKTSSPPGGIAGHKFIGAYHTTSRGVDDGVSGANTACLKVENDSGDDYYFFYHVLLAR